jgi:uncharacterized protein (TIGR03790 family)
MKRLAILLIVLVVAPAMGTGGQPAVDAHSRPAIALHPATTPVAAVEGAPCVGAPAALSAPAQRAGAANYSDVLLLVNNQSQISMDVGSYFKLKRGIPDGNVCNISMPTSEWIDRSQFQSVRAAIESFINGSGLNSSLNYIVTAKGCPLGVWDSNSRYASFMDEIGLILGPYSSAIGNNGWLDNPFLNSQERFSRQKFGIFIVTRLDGYDLADCLGLVDNALNGTGARGQFVLDSQPWHDGGGYQAGNDWCRAAAATLKEKGYDVLLDDTPTYVTYKTNVSGYASWGSNDGNAPDYAKTHFTWVPGAIGTTYVSTSARSFADPPSYGQSLIADNIHEGITGIHGNVAEPYLYACAMPDVFLDRYTRAWNLGESFYAGMATQSWQNCVIGDPKIEPYSTQPDPAVSGGDISFAPADLVEGMNVTITALVRNLGGSPAVNTTAAFFFDGKPGPGIQIGGNITIPLIPAHGNITVQVSWDTTHLPGVHEVYVNVTAFNNTPEIWDGNNLALANATVFIRPDLSLPRDRFTVSSLSPREGDLVWFNVTVMNTGGFRAATQLVYLMDGAAVHTANISLQGGQQALFGYGWNSQGRPGPHHLVIEAVPVPFESDTGDNNLTGDLFVRHFGLSAAADSPGQAVLPGGSASFNLTLTSGSNTGENVDVSVSPAPPYWAGTVDPETVSLAPGAMSAHRVVVTAPALGTVTDRWDLLVRFEGRTSGVVCELNLTVTVLPVRSLKLSCDPGEASALPGENATFKLTVRNLGNGPDSANLSFAAPAGWKVTVESASLDLPYGGSLSTMVKVSPPASALAGAQENVTLIAASLDGSSFTASAAVGVEQYYGLETSLEPDRLTLMPGGEAASVLRVNNTGNGPDSVTVVIPSTELSVGVNLQTFTIEAFTGMSVELTVKAPDKYAGSKEKLQLGVESAHVARVLAALNVEILHPDIALSGDRISISPAAPVEGQAVTVTVELRNIGTGPTGPVTVRLSEFAGVISNASVAGIAPDGNATVRLAWNATSAGTHELKVSCAFSYRDPTPDDDAASVVVSVAARPVKRPSTAGGMASTIPVVAGAVILVIAVVAIAAVFAMRRKGSPPEVGGGDRNADAKAGFSMVAGDGTGNTPPRS